MLQNNHHYFPLGLISKFDCFFFTSFTSHSVMFARVRLMYVLYDNMSCLRYKPIKSNDDQPYIVC